MTNEPHVASPTPNEEETKSTWRKLKNKIQHSLKSLSHEALVKALTLYYTLEAPETPLWCRTVILGALGYFISIIDGIPDLTPVLGYTDDLSVMAAAIATLSMHITPEIEERAKQKADRILAKKS